MRCHQEIKATKRKGDIKKLKERFNQPDSGTDDYLLEVKHIKWAQRPKLAQRLTKPDKVGNPVGAQRVRRGAGAVTDSAQVARQRNFPSLCSALLQGVVWTMQGEPLSNTSACQIDLRQRGCAGGTPVKGRPAPERMRCCLIGLGEDKWPIIEHLVIAVVELTSINCH